MFFKEKKKQKSKKLEDVILSINTLVDSLNDIKSELINNNSYNKMDVVSNDSEITSKKKRGKNISSLKTTFNIIKKYSRAKGLCSSDIVEFYRTRGKDVRNTSISRQLRTLHDKGDIECTTPELSHYKRYRPVGKYK